LKTENPFQFCFDISFEKRLNTYIPTAYIVAHSEAITYLEKKASPEVLQSFGIIFERLRKLVKAIFLLCFLPIRLSAQDQLAMPVIPAMRQLHHEYIINSIQKINQLPAVKDSGYTQQLVWVDETITGIRAGIERNKRLDDNAKYRWLRSVNDLLTAFLQAYQVGQISLKELEPLIKAYQQAMKFDWAEQSIYPVFENNELVSGNLFVDNVCLKTNQGIQAAKDFLV